MNLRQCVDCLSLRCESLDEMALQRISYLLASRHTVLDITPLLNMLCATATASVSDGDAAHVAMCIKRHREDASVTIRGASVLNRTCCTTKLRHSTAQRLELALSLADRHLVVLDDASMLQRRIGKHMQRIAHCVHQAGGQRAASTVDAPVIAARSAVLDYAACFGGSTAHRNGKLHSALLNADQG
ncbi:hypothetical protein BBBOND_0110800 [Babesia bigemina]|nr:hypothetical protein BBBOND_0110800 [Babesia bigemina]CDR94783.1 hypothetical protein BBBOND_0110800 [Babesia bigemina]|eukprot:XP_012766969.1 hypothetical protein BBBOND_0110800 [Babesia bigemina]